ncbi:ABC transporter permease [Mesorhizobium sp. M2A.F.Ca.ET.042.01.1.1]|uniref:ABC transporter permease n=1 Tax=Mesorhizobium sp. M2A.F.Ca.ET.042.01.1.1 TaxID=2496745 RepID=UPI000FCBB848|nr:ABC transporter permease [Mesorhizobium sp. M2A.F.Ca.ET.042.01.1.1]RUX19286.1 ABC transporter permease [Mesorhizobium sp. M2A.F.Ca.ET.042.01.1.1]
MDSNKASTALRIYFWIGILYLLFPIVIVLPASFSASPFLHFPPTKIGLDWYRAYFFDSSWLAATMLSLRVGLLASLIATVTGTLAAVGIAKSSQRLRTPLIFMATFPMVLPQIFIALGVFILALQFGATDNAYVLALAHAAVGVPLVVLIVNSSMKQISPTLERAARVLGAGPLNAFRVATLPRLKPAIVASTIFSFFASFDDLVISLFLMSGQETLPMRIWADLKLEFSPTVAAVSSLLIVATSASMWFAEMLRRKAIA